MRLLRKLISPLAAFIGIQLLWVLVVVVWVYYFMGTHRRLRELAEAYSPDLLQRGADWFILVEGLVLLVAILAGVYVIFLYWTRQRALYRAQRNFVSQVTHELKSPLASLQLHLETIRLRHPPPEKLDGFVQTMLADADRLHGLINNLLSASRVEQRNVRFLLTECDLSVLVERYFAGRRGFLPAGARLAVEVEPALRAAVEREYFEVMLRNLLENATIYSGEAPDIRVSLVREGRQAHLAISDRGRGIESPYLKKAFNMFYRVRSTSQLTRGTGLGLFIVKAIVRRHGGKVWLESAGLGKGTTAHVLLPLSDPRWGGGGVMAEVRILLVEDEPHIATGLTFNLEAEGFRVDHVGTGEQALKRLVGGGYSLVVLDVMLPGVDGFHVCREIRKRDPRLPVLMLTARSEDRDRVAGLALGADDYLTKPFNLEEFLLRVRGMLRRSRWYRNGVDPGRVFRFGDNQVDLGRWTAWTPRGEVQLTELEVRFLSAFFGREGEVLDRTELLESVWGLPSDSETRTLDNFMVRVRKYFEVDPSNPVHFLTVRGRGYRFVREEAGVD